jgi:hypothetical protein
MYETFDSYQLCTDREKHSEKTEISDAAEFARKRLQFEPDERQSEVLRSTAKRGILNCTRQWGKSTVAAAKAVHRAFTQAKSLACISHTGLVSREKWG